MKRYIVLIILLFVSYSGWSQLDRSQKPVPGPPPEIQLGEVATFTLKNGMKVFVVENRKLPRVSFSLLLDNDPILEKENAGYVSMMGQLLRSGTTTRNKAKLDEDIDFLGAYLSTSSTGVYASSLKKHADQIVQIMADVVLNPAFPESELEKLKKQTISALAANKDDANAIAANVAQVLRYGKDHPYGEVTTEETVENIEMVEIKEYYNTYYKPNNAYLAVVGDISKKEAEKLVKKYFSGWEKGDVPKAEYPAPKAPEETIIALVDRPNAVQSVINVTYPLSLTPGHPDVVKSNVMNQILGGAFSSRLNMNLREKNGYTYGANSSLVSDKLAGSFRASASVRNEVTANAINEFLFELNNIKQRNVTQDELQNIKNYLTGSFARSLENPQTIANFAINIDRYNLPEDYYTTYLKKIDAVTLDDVQEMADKYITANNAYILVVGKGEEIIEGISKYGKLQHYDIYGNNFTPTEKSALPDGLTAEKVIENYITALGGEGNLSKIKDLKMVMNATIQGNKIEIVQTSKSPDKFVREVKMGTMVMQKEVYNGNEGVIFQQGQRMPVTEEEKKDFLFKAALVPEIEYQKKGLEAVLKGIEIVEGEEVYVVAVTLPSGTINTLYYNTTTGLKVKESSNMATPQGDILITISYNGYTQKSGVNFPEKITLSPPGLAAEMVSLEINQGVADNLFETK